MATQKQQTTTGLASGITEEQAPRRLALKIEALEARIAPSTDWGDDPITFEDPPEEEPSSTLP